MSSRGHFLSPVPNPQVQFTTFAPVPFLLSLFLSAWQVRTQLVYAEENVEEMERQVKETEKELPAKELAVQKLKDQLTEAQVRFRRYRFPSGDLGYRGVTGAIGLGRFTV
jgi:hypothetical protein